MMVAKAAQKKIPRQFWEAPGGEIHFTENIRLATGCPLLPPLPTESQHAKEYPGRVRAAGGVKFCIKSTRLETGCAT